METSIDRENDAELTLPNINSKKQKWVYGNTVENENESSKRINETDMIASFSRNPSIPNRKTNEGKNGL